MVRNAASQRWSAKGNEKSESIVESCLRVLMRFLSLKKCMAECFLVLSSQSRALSSRIRTQENCHVRFSRP